MDTVEETRVARGRAARGRRRWGRRLAVLSTLVVAIPLLVIGGGYGFIVLREAHDPSGRVAIDIDGQRQWLVQPTGVVTPPPYYPRAGFPTVAQGDRPAPRASSPSPTVRTTPLPTAAIRPLRPGEGPEGGTQPTPPATATISTPLPPLHLAIPSIGVDVPVILVDNEHLMRISAAGWLFGTAFPATAGNLVLLGHLDGKAAIFGQLAEVQVGDEIRVTTAAGVQIYIVDSMQTVDDRALQVLAPTTDPIITVITCAGDWDAATHSYNRRLVVRGHYAAIEPR